MGAPILRDFGFPKSQNSSLFQPSNSSLATNSPLGNISDRIFRGIRDLGILGQEFLSKISLAPKVKTQVLSSATTPTPKKVVIIKDAEYLKSQSEKLLEQKWDRIQAHTWLLFSIELVGGLSTLPVMIEPEVYVELMGNRTASISLITMGGIGLGAAAGNLACRGIDDIGWYFGCQGLTALAGGALAFGISYALVDGPSKFDSNSMMPPDPPIPMDHRFPTDNYGP